MYGIIRRSYILITSGIERVKFVVFWISVCRFLFDNHCPEHIYYRWKLFSILQVCSGLLCISNVLACLHFACSLAAFGISFSLIGSSTSKFFFLFFFPNIQSQYSFLSKFTYRVIPLQNGGQKNLECLIMALCGNHLSVISTPWVQQLLMPINNLCLK